MTKSPEVSISRGISISFTGTESFSRMVITLARVMPPRMLEERFGVQTTPFFTRNTFSPLPSLT